MRAIWKGAVSFGLVSVPVKLYSATESHDVSFRQVHAKDGGRVKYKRICSIDGEEVPYSDIAKGYELADGAMVVLTDGAEITLESSTIANRFCGSVFADSAVVAFSKMVPPASLNLS